MINKLFNLIPVWKFGKQWKYLAIASEHKHGDNFFGRFGGGWNWKIGFQLGGSTIIFNFLIFTIRIQWRFTSETR